MALQNYITAQDISLRPKLDHIRSRQSVHSSLDGVVNGETVDARSLASIDRPPSHEDHVPSPKVYPPYSPQVIALLMPASVFGVLARLGLLALTSYDGQSIFPLAYVQAFGCLFMGIGLSMKEPIGQL